MRVTAKGEGRRRVSNRVARYAFNEILDDAKTTTSTTSTISAAMAAAATIAIVEMARFDLKV